MTLRSAAQRHGPTAVLSALAGAALVTLAFANATPGTLNSVTLDNGTCGHNLQLGSDSTASSSAAPWFLLYGDGGAASYSLFIDGVSIGTYHTTDIYGHVCIADPVPLADGPHTLTGNETTPHAYTVPAFTFSVDTVPPAVPVIASITVGTQNTSSCKSSLQIRGTSDPRVTIRAYNGPSGLGGAAADSNGNWYAATLGLAPGMYNVTAVALDQAGNVSARSAARTVTVPPCATPSPSASAATAPPTPSPTPTPTLPPPTATPAPTPLPTPTPCGS